MNDLASMALGAAAGAAAGAAVYCSRPRRESFLPSRKRETVVGLFFHTWHDINPVAARRVMNEDAWRFGWYWWGRPAFGGGDVRQYTWSNPALVDHHIDLLDDLDVDFIFLDFTNGNHEPNVAAAKTLCERLRQRKAKTKVVFWIQKAADAALYKRTFYDKFPEQMFRWKGKPLLLLQGIVDGWRPSDPRPKPLPRGGLLDDFTVRWCWGLLGGHGGMWTFKETNPSPKPYVHDGRPEQIGMTFATQATHMTTAGDGRRCRDGGKFFQSQIPNVRKHRPQIVTLCGFNEWMAINTSNGPAPQFVDLFGPDCSHDIEPMRGGHGDTYYKMAKQFIASLP